MSMRMSMRFRFETTMLVGLVGVLSMCSSACTDISAATEQCYLGIDTMCNKLISCGAFDEMGYEFQAMQCDRALEALLPNGGSCENATEAQDQASFDGCLDQISQSSCTQFTSWIDNDETPNRCQPQQSSE